MAVRIGDVSVEELLKKHLAVLHRRVKAVPVVPPLRADGRLVSGHRVGRVEAERVAPLVLVGRRAELRDEDGGDEVRVVRVLAVAAAPDVVVHRLGGGEGGDDAGAEEGVGGVEGGDEGGEGRGGG